MKHNNNHLLVVILLFTISIYSTIGSIQLSETNLQGDMVTHAVWLGPTYEKLILKTTTGVYRSSDTGKTWQNITLSEPDSIITIAVHPLNNQIIFLVGQDYLWRSTDGSQTFLKINHDFVIDKFVFHHRLESYILASLVQCNSVYCYYVLYVTYDLGETWTEIRNFVWDFDWHIFSDNLIFVWEKVGKTNDQNYDSQLVLSRDFFQTSVEVVEEQVMGYLMLDNIIFIAKEEAVGMSYSLWSSINMGVNFTRARFPPAVILETNYRIYDSSEGSVFIRVQHGSAENDPGNIYTSNSLLGDFSLSLSNNPNGDFKQVQSIEGIYIANTYELSTSRDIQTVITYDKGARWQRLPKPNNINCIDPISTNCHLNLVGRSQAGSWLTDSQAIGIIIGSGNVGHHLDPSDDTFGVYYSRDMGWNWDWITNGQHTYEIGNRGSIILMAPINTLTDSFSYSLNEGLTWETSHFSENIYVYDINSDPLLQHPYFIVHGFDEQGNSQLIHVNFTGLLLEECKGERIPGAPNSDYELWEPTDSFGNSSCILGRSITYIRRKQSSECLIPIPSKISDFIFINNCSCTILNYECDYCFTMDSSGLCSLDPDCGNYNPHQRPDPCIDSWFDTNGYRRVPGDSCDINTGLNLLPTLRSCEIIPPLPPTPQPQVTPPPSPPQPTSPPQIEPSPLPPPPQPTSPPQIEPSPLPLPPQPTSPPQIEPSPLPPPQVQPPPPAPSTEVIPPEPVPNPWPTPTRIPDPAPESPSDDGKVGESVSSEGKLVLSLLVVFLVLTTLGIFMICLLAKTNSSVHEKLAKICPESLLPSIDVDRVYDGADEEDVNILNGDIEEEEDEL